MDLAVGQITRAFRVYQNQLRIGELNRQSHLRTVQDQQDQVTLSAEAQRLFEQAQHRPEPPPPVIENPETESAENAAGEHPAASGEDESGSREAGPDTFVPLDFTQITSIQEEETEHKAGSAPA